MHLLAADWLWLDDVVVVRWTLLLVVTLLRVLDDDADGQANVKILEWLGSSAFCLRSWMAWAMEIRTELGHLVTDWRIDSQFSLTLTRIFQIKSREAHSVTLKKGNVHNGVDSLTDKILALRFAF